jgi:hypothetical protein
VAIPILISQIPQPLPTDSLFSFSQQQDFFLSVDPDHKHNNPPQLYPTLPQIAKMAASTNVSYTANVSLLLSSDTPATKMLTLL